MSERKPGRPETGQTKKRTNVTLDKELLEEAKDLNVKVSPACEDGLERAVKKARKEKGKG